MTCIGYAASLGLDTDRFAAALRKHAGAAHVSADVDSADLSNVSGTPTFFVYGRRHYGASGQQREERRQTKLRPGG